MKKNFTILFAVLLICMCSLVAFAAGDGVYKLECGTVGDDLHVYVTNNGSEDVVISPVFASFDADGRLYNSKVWLNVTIPAGENVGFDLTDRFDETRLNKLFFFDSELCPIREAEELVAKDDDIIFDTDDLFKDPENVVSGKTYGDAYTLVETMSGNGKNGLANGWSYDNRFELDNVTGAKKGYLFDDNDETFTALRRKLAAVEKDGLLHAEFVLTLSSEDGGVYLSFEDEDGNRVVEITEEGGLFKLCGENSVVSDVAFNDEPTEYVVIVDIDLDENKASARVDGKGVGTVNIGEDDGISGIVLGTNDAGTGSVTLTHAYVVKNYPVIECFLTKSEGAVPADWNVSGKAEVKKIESELGNDVYSLKLSANANETTTVSKSFDAVSGVLDIGTFMLMPEEADGAEFCLLNDDKAVLTIKAQDGAFWCGATKLCDVMANVWQDVHIIADTKNKTAEIKINGKSTGNVSFKSRLVNGVKYTLTTETANTLWVDDITVKCVTEYEDYPEEPVVAESTDYNIGINVCNIWRDGHTVQGWDSVSGYPEYESVLGYYDEGLAETADWEIKFLAEHGVDFMQICWYAPYTAVTQPIKRSQMAHSALHDGYMNAKYSDKVKFCILWENAYGGATNTEQFKNFIWPYWKTYYFSDDRYMTLDGKALLSIYNLGSFINAFGSEAKAAEVVAFMEAELVDMGYDGLVLLFSSGSTASYLTLANIGGDGTYAYGWGEEGVGPYFQKLLNTMCSDTASSVGVVHLPTIAVGYNARSITGERHENITSGNFEIALVDAKSILDSRSGSDWKTNTLFLSNWNEYSEGSVIMPTIDNGFGYLDGVRKVFTDGTSHSDDVPTASQKERVTHMYPQDRSEIYRYVTKENGIPEYLETVKAYSMSSTSGTLAWEKDFNLDSYEENRSSGWIKGVSSADDYSIITSKYFFENVDASSADYMHIRMSSTGLGFGQIYFATSADSVLSESKKLNYFVEKPGEFVDYYIKMSDNENWKGTVTKVRIDPVGAPSTFYITDIDFMKMTEPENIPEITVNGKTLSFSFDPKRIYSGDTVEDFEVYGEKYGSGFFSMLRLYSEWNRHDGVLTLKSRDNTTAVLTVGSDKAVVDGSDVSLGYTFDLYDGLPVIRIKKLCELFDYDCTMSEDEIVIYACNDEEREQIDKEASYSWEFNNAQNIGSWTARMCNVSFANDGCMTITATDDDAGISHAVNFDAEEYTTILIGLRYTPSMDGKFGTVYFSADKGIDSFSVRYDDLTANKSYGDLVIWEINTKSNAAFDGKVELLRFDPSTGNGDVFKVDFIRCTKEEDKDTDFDTSILF